MSRARNSKIRTVIDAKKPLKVVITEEHQKCAKPGDPAHCVVALALNDAFGDIFDGAEVGSSITKVYTSNRIIRYATPASLKKNIPVFDKTGKWQLPSGEYILLPVPTTAKLGARGNRWRTYRHKTRRTGRAMFKARALPTRRVMRVETLAAV